MRKSDEIYTGKYDVHVFDHNGDLLRCKYNLLRSTAGEFADDARPRHGATYIVKAGEPLNFKKVYRTRGYQPRYPSTKRPSIAAIAALAERMRKAGDSENADALVAMAYANRK